MHAATRLCVPHGCCRHTDQVEAACIAPAATARWCELSCLNVPFEWQSVRRDGTVVVVGAADAPAGGHAARCLKTGPGNQSSNEAAERLCNTQQQGVDRNVYVYVNVVGSEASAYVGVSRQAWGIGCTVLWQRFQMVSGVSRWRCHQIQSSANAWSS